MMEQYENNCQQSEISSSKKNSEHERSFSENRVIEYELPRMAYLSRINKKAT